MAIWTPKVEEPIGKQEAIGRRLFDEPMLAGVPAVEASFRGLDLRNFEEKRDLEFSVDRMGRTGIDKKVAQYLHSRADAQATSFTTQKTFHGWAVLRAGALATPPKGTPLSPVASPIRGEGLSENIYHAHLVLPEQDSYSNALHLRHLFTSKGAEVHKASPKDAPSDTESFGRRLINRLAAIFSRD